MTLETNDRWARLIGQLIMIKSRLDEVCNGFWPYHLPRVPASDEQIAFAEASLNWLLPDDFREFLKHADGWLGFLQEIDLFGCARIAEGTRSSHFRECYLEALTADDWRVIGVEPAALVPIGAAPFDASMFAIDKTRSTTERSTILWMSPQVVDTRHDLESFFLSVVEYNKREVARFVT